MFNKRLAADRCAHTDLVAACGGFYLSVTADAAYRQAGCGGMHV
jgi:hypothetical protein